MSGINTNVASLFAQTNLAKSGSQLATAIERLSSGLRINSAKDDAAGLAIAERFRSEISGNEVAKRNASDGISALETAEGALASVTDSLQRMRELAVQGSTGTLTSEDRELLTNEFNALKNNVNDIIASTSFNGIDLLTTAAGQTNLDVQVGDSNGATDSLVVSLGDIEGAFSEFQVTSETTFGTARATTADITLADVTGGAIATTLAADESADLDLDGDGTNDIRFSSDGTDLFYQFIDSTGQGIGDPQDTTLAGNTALGTVTLENIGVAAADADDGSVEISLGNLSANLVSDDADFTGIQFLTKLEGTDAVNSRKTIEQLDTFITAVSEQRSVLGAGINRLESVISNLDTSITSTSAARGRIIDADFAKETANLTRAQILQQAGTSVLAQANQLPSNVLALLG